MITHVVIFRTRNADKVKILRDGVQSLQAIEGPLFFCCGTPLASDRPVVDDTFSVGLVVGFSNEAALNAYAVHPIHLAFLNGPFKAAQAKSTVYDIKA